jgi:glyoxylase-like metal-dependent hydrolase (beta-lactamase superfamily II)/rhodanese-related sulfurtransferase
MIEVVPFVDEGLGNSSYLVDLGDGSALAVDPSRDPTPYLAEAKRRGLHVRFAAETHLHADFISGGRDLSAEGATLIAPAGADLRFEHRSVGEGEDLDLGGLALHAISTPGHTPEHLSYLLLDAGRPLALFTGGALIVGSIARTDLTSPEQAQLLTHAAYRSARMLLDGYPEDLAVYPTHGGGSFCSVSGSSERTSSVGVERRTNLVCSSDEEAFVDAFLRSLGTYPPYFLRSRTINQNGAPLGAHRRTLMALTVEDVSRSATDGAVVVDVRPFEAFARGHIPDSISIELRPQFASWLGWVVTADTPIIFVADERQDRTELLRQTLKIGYDVIEGELLGGFEAWRSAGQPVATIDLRAVPDSEGTMVDVRQASEVAAGKIRGAVAVEAGSVADAQLPDGPLTLYCGHGQRGMTAASLLERAGRADLNVLVGGPNDWSEATGEPLEVSA